VEVQCGLQTGEQQSEILMLTWSIREICPRTAQIMFTFYFDKQWKEEKAWEMWLVLSAASNPRSVSLVELPIYILLEIKIECKRHLCFPYY
jgi:hypothetical protein